MPAAAEVYGQVTGGISLGASTEVDASTGPFTASGDLDLDNGWLASVAIGDTLPHNLRLEGEFLFSGNDMSDLGIGDVEVSQWAGMANLLYDINTNASYKPYVGVGAGLGRTNVELDGDETGEAGLAWQLKAGVAVAVNDKMSWDVGYRYMSLAQLKISDGTSTAKFEPSFHALTVGFRMVIGE